jgi:NADH-quinone oxidoreductase subunit L
MNRIFDFLWVIPALPLLAAGFISLAPRRCKIFAVSLSIGAMAIALILSCAELAVVLRTHGPALRIHNFPWLQIGSGWLELGWMLDPLTAVMLVMVCLVGLLIFIYSVGYMAHDENVTRFFCFLSLFAAAMLGLIIANSLLLFFACWELVGLTSYLLIGFWFQKPAAVAAAKKAFITTRVGDLAFFLGMLWVFSSTNTLSFYDHGKGFLESAAIGGLASATTVLGLTVATGISLLIFCGAMGKSGQFPLHVWLPDAMEGPTPVSALIHAATMVAAGVFLMARIFPLVSSSHTALLVIGWVGAISALFAATIAVVQTDIKRILAYSTISQLGFMMLGLAAGGVAVGMFHLITHAFFKALLFLGAGSVIHGCREEQDIRCMGGLRKLMPVTFLTYAIGMMALSGVPILFSGFWSKDEILHAAWSWKAGQGPFYLAIAGAFLTVLYMTRQVIYVFFGSCRLSLGPTAGSEQRTIDHIEGDQPAYSVPDTEIFPHESPSSMTLPLLILAGCSVALGFLGTPAWPWFQSFISGTPAHITWSHLFEKEVVALMGVSTVIVLSGIFLGWWFYGSATRSKNVPLPTSGSLLADIGTLLARKYYVDEFYSATVTRVVRWWSIFCNWLDDWIFESAISLITALVEGLSWVSARIDELGLNPAFDQMCRGCRYAGRTFRLLQNGKAQSYLKGPALALILIGICLIWGCHPK